MSRPQSCGYLQEAELPHQNLQAAATGIPLLNIVALCSKNAIKNSYIRIPVVLHQQSNTVHIQRTEALYAYYSDWRVHPLMEKLALASNTWRQGKEKRERKLDSIYGTPKRSWPLRVRLL
jgi:hypothetical protein